MYFDGLRIRSSRSASARRCATAFVQFRGNDQICWTNWTKVSQIIFNVFMRSSWKGLTGMPVADRWF
jgi:hypothetical protein